MLPAGLNFEVSELAKFQSSEPKLASSRSRLSQQVESYSLADERDIPDSQLSVRRITLNVQASVTNTMTVKVGSDAGGSMIVNGNVENYPHHPKRGLSPVAIMVKREWSIDSLAV